MLIGMQQVFQLCILLYYLPSSTQIFVKREKITKSTVITQPELYQTSDAFRFARIIQMLNKTLTSLDPLSIWLVKDRYPTLEALQMNLVKMSPCIQNQENPRFELALLKVLKGESINVVIYGGSNCAQGMFPLILRDWWNKVITPISGSWLNLKIIGIGGTGSGYYQFCHDTYLRGETIDLVILETAVNDVVNTVVGMSNINRNLPLEQLTRQLLNRPNNPAVFYVNLFLISEQNSQCLNLVDYGQVLISDIYRITTFDLRCLCCRSFEGKFYTDTKTYDVQQGWHSTLLGHAQIAFMIIHVISKTIAKMTQDANRLMVNDLSWFNAINSKIPPLPLPVYIKGESSTITSPQCWTNLTPDYREDIFHNSLWLNLVRNIGFKYINSVTIGRASYSAESVSRTDAVGGLLGNAINAEVTVLFTVTSQRSEGPVSTGSVGIVSRRGKTAGAVEAWLDDRYDKRVRIPLLSQKSQTAVAIIATHVQPGTHSLTMRIVEEGNSVLVGVFVGPPEWP